MNKFNQNFFSNNSAQVNKLNDLINQSKAALACGPSCQKDRKSEELKQKYINAQTNVIAAPDELKTAQKNYFLFSQGVASYDKVIETELTGKVDKIASVMQAEFDENIQNAENLTSNFGILDQQFEHIQDLKKKYMKENAAMALEIKDTITDIVTNDRKTYYQEQNMTREYGWYNLYTIIYVIMMALFLIFIFSVDSNYSFKVKIIAFIIFFAYPWISGPIIFRIMAGIQHVSDMLPKNIYENL
uniref:Uncharacterized protein n=1 Tax=viral metagenome TaxID=1070528 RepID=A0A6C0KVZ1_9ZZZZ